MVTQGGDELFYVVSREGRGATSEVVSVAVQLGDDLALGNTQTLFRGPYATDDRIRQSDVSPEGDRFLMMIDTDTPAEVVLVRNWFDELQRLVPAP